MAKQNTPFRYDYVGSFLRPEALKVARSKYEAGTITKEELTSVEDQEIRALVEKQKAAGYKVLTDGEFRRATWHLDFMWGFDGVGHSKTETGLPFHGEAAMIDDTYLTGKVAVTGEHPFVEHFRFVKALEDENTVAKQTIPAPAQFLEQMIMPFAMPNTSKYYEDTEELVQDIAEGYRKVIKDLYAAGCRNLQLDDCSWGMLVDPNAKAFFGTDEEGLEAIKEQLVRINNLAIEGKLAAVICIEDPLREEASAVVQSLKRAGLSKVVMMTGDSERTAAAIAKRVGVDEYYSEVLPEDKASFVEREKAAGRKVIMIGDGINDSPALSAANVGIAISDGAEIAREIADITVSSDDLYQIVTLKLLSDSLMERIKKNYRRIVGFNSLLIVLGVTGVIQPTTSALLHNSSTLLIGLESMQNLLD